MGALHEGHLSLIRYAASLKHQVVVSIFLNPTQFAPTEDLESYPSTPTHDLELAEQAGADLIFMPAVKTIYPNGLEAATEEAARLSLPEVATKPGLEDADRPHFFGGVCLVVGRLFDLVRPGATMFGEKDYQQLLSIREMVTMDADRFGGIQVIGRPTIREPDGLAMSSRNAYLNDETRPRALGLFTALQAVRELGDPNEAEARMRVILADHGLDVDYATVRDADSLQPPDSRTRSYRALIAARLDQVRLIDNAPTGT